MRSRNDFLQCVAPNRVMNFNTTMCAAVVLANANPLTRAKLYPRNFHSHHDKSVGLLTISHHGAN